MSVWVTELFRDIDRKDADKFVTYITKEGKFTFGNAPMARGTEEIRKAVSGFFGSVAALHHDILNVWNSGPNVIVELSVTYTRKDGKKVTLPCVDVFTMEDEKVADYKIFMDISPVYA